MLFAGRICEQLAEPKVDKCAIVYSSLGDSAAWASGIAVPLGLLGVMLASDSCSSSVGMESM